MFKTFDNVEDLENTENKHALYLIPLDNSKPLEIVRDGDPWYPKYSPDGKWILYTRGDYTAERH